MRILGLDVGTKTIGVAVSDAMKWTAQAFETIPINAQNGDMGWKRLKAIVEEQEIESIVVGLPKNMNGSVGERGQACQDFAQKAEQKLKKPVMLWDERLSTVAAERVLIDADVSRKKRKQVIDQMAAVMILQGYLDSKKF